MSNFVQANGVQMGFVRTKSLAQEPVQLGPDYAALRFVATWEVTISRLTFGTANFAVPNAGTTPVATSGTGAYLTLYQQVMAPRRSLQLRVGNTDLINIGPAGDVELGPKPLKFVVLGVNSNGSLVAEYTTQYTVPNPCPGRNGKMAFLAHVWKAEDDLDRHFFMTRTYTGVIHLDPRVVGAGGDIHPDTIRRLYLPPRTVGMHREQVQVRTLEDGYTLAYRVTDRQPTAIVNSRDVVRMEADHKIDHGVPGKATRAQLVADTESIHATGFDAWFSPTQWGLGNRFIGAGARTARLVQLENTPSLIPSVTHTVTATAFGHPASRYADLTRAARVVVLWRLMNAGAYLPQGEKLDFDGRFIQHDRSDPKSSTCTLSVTTRPIPLHKAPILGGAGFIAGVVFEAVNDAQAQDTWNRGLTLMPRINNNVVTPQPVSGPVAEPIPLSIRNLVYGGSVLNEEAEHWGWLDRAFAPDLMSDKDATAGGEAQQFRQFVRVDGAVPQGISGTALADPLPTALLAAVQNLCDYKKPATFNQQNQMVTLP